MTYSTPVNAYDLTATVAMVGGAKTAQGETPSTGLIWPGFQGRSELAYDRPQFFRRRTVKVRSNQNQIRQSAVRQGDWKYLRTYKTGDSDKYNSFLFNLKDDIGETRNLATERPEKVKALAKLLAQWEAEMAETAAPFAQSKN